MASDHDMVANLRSTRLSAGADRAHLMYCTISTDSGQRMHANWPNMWNEHPGTDPSVRVQADVGHYGEYFPCRNEHKPDGPPKRTRTSFDHASLRSIDRQRPEPFRAPAAVAMLLESSQIRTPGAPLAIAGPLFDFVTVVRSHSEERAESNKWKGKSLGRLGDEGMGRW